MRAVVVLMIIFPTVSTAQVSLSSVRDNPKIDISVDVVFDPLPTVQEWRDSLNAGFPVLRRPEAGEVNIEYVEIHRQALESHRKVVIEENWRRLGEICRATKRTIDDLLLLSKAKIITQDTYEDHKRTALDILPKCNQGNAESAYRIAYDDAISSIIAANEFANKIIKNCQNLKPYCGL